MFRIRKFMCDSSANEYTLKMTGNEEKHRVNTRFICRVGIHAPVAKITLSASSWAYKYKALANESVTMAVQYSHVKTSAVTAYYACSVPMMMLVKEDAVAQRIA